jgi:hypothetical protein
VNKIEKPVKIKKKSSLRKKYRNQFELILKQFKRNEKEDTKLCKMIGLLDVKLLNKKEEKDVHQMEYFKRSESNVNNNTRKTEIFKNVTQKELKKK